MKSDKLRQFVILRDSLQNEKAQLEARLAQIYKALGEEGRASAPTSTARPVGRPVGRPSGAPRKVSNELSLKEAVRKVTTGRPSTKQEILKAINKIGYRFSAKDPMNSLNVVLYTKGQFKNDSGKFSPEK